MIRLDVEIMYLVQHGGSTCMAVAIINLCRYLKKPEPDFDVLVNALYCRTGNAIHVDKVIFQIFDNIIKVDTLEEFANMGGILNLMHPIYNLHSVCAFPDSGALTLINSWLGPNVISYISIEEVSRFLPPNHLQAFWTIR